MSTEERSGLLLCPECRWPLQSTTQNAALVKECPHCGKDVSELLSPMRVGCLSNFGVGLSGAIAGGLWAGAIALLIWGEEFNAFAHLTRAVLLGSIAAGLLAWLTVLNLPVHQRMNLERKLFIANCMGAVAFTSGLFGVSWLWMAVGVLAAYPASVLIWRRLQSHICNCSGQ